MSIQIVQERLLHYLPKTEQDEENAVKEIIQEICLAGLARAGFSKVAAFQGGTCLRILYGLPRFSEDLNFILKETTTDFEMKKYLNLLGDELRAYGFNFEISDRSKADQAVKKAFLKEDSWAKVLRLSYPQPAQRTPKKITIKLEVDTHPPRGSHYEEKILNFPFPFSILSQDRPSLFGGKAHALLCRDYDKGRDWYDFLWYIRNKIKPNYAFLKNALEQQGPWKDQKNLKIDDAWFTKHITAKIKKVDWKVARQDIQRFLKPYEQESLNLWSKEFFLNQTAQVFRE